MSKCTYLECGYRDACDKDDDDCLLDRVTRGQELRTVIPCRNCKFHMRINDTEGHCRKIGQKTNRQFFCEYGKWKG